ncbi:bZIP transcription factor 49 [Podospora conica]|nr:bZIP transcription factor 49 [Schizothecium conicum]
MVTAFSMQSFYRTPLTVDTTSNAAHKYFDDEDVLDENILDQGALDSGLEMSPPLVESRRDSFAVSAMFSPKTEDWSAAEMQSVPSNNPFFDHSHSNNPFMRLEQSQQAVYQSWPMTSSGSATPLQTFDGLPAEFDANVSLFHRPTPMQVQTPFTNPTNQVALFQQLGHPAGQSLPTSPQKDLWMSQELKNHQAMAKRTRPASPLIRSHNDLRRGDGIRKKNARFEIPSERNLGNIDQLISQSTDEQEIKELKQQKRLLRNRQAALDSRQRKKQHTERLEDEKKLHTEVMSSMEDQITKLEQEMEQLMREKQSYETYIREMERKQEEMIATHTIETGELRKKVSVLTSHVQSLESANMASNASGFEGSFGNLDAMNMDAPWEDIQMFGSFPMDLPVEAKQQERQLVAAKKPEVALTTDCEKPAQQGGLLFMLFLVGAFVLSSRSTTPSIPRVSEDVRAASATLLENVLKDAGVAHAASSIGAMAPQPSGHSWSQPGGPSSLPMAAPVMDNVAPSMLGDMVDSLTHTTEQQANEQLFSLSVEQYNDLSSQDFPRGAPAEKSSGPGRRNLADALANMRTTDKQSAAEVYTRSLLWDQIPSDVVRTFAKMVAESSGQQGTVGRDDGDS